MSHVDDKEVEVRLQFLDEAQEYLSTIEDALLRVSDHQVDVQKINAALRAAHSIKGGAAMMGFEILSELAHRLEDSFKILKVRRDTIEVDADLEKLLLIGVDCLHEVIGYDRREQPVNRQWLDSRVYPVFERLHDYLGDLPEEDANSVLSPEDGQDVVALLFETEVEGCLQRLETALETADPCLREELEILAQELGGLGEMLELSRFIQLCQSVEQSLQAAPQNVEAIAKLALQQWRRSQALVLTGNLAELPNTLDGLETVGAVGTIAASQVVLNVSATSLEEEAEEEAIAVPLNVTIADELATDDQLDDDLTFDEPLTASELSWEEAAALELLLADPEEPSLGSAVDSWADELVDELADELANESGEAAVELETTTFDDVQQPRSTSETPLDHSLDDPLDNSLDSLLDSPLDDIEMLSDTNQSLTENFPEPIELALHEIQSTDQSTPKQRQRERESKVTDFRILEDSMPNTTASPPENTVRVPLKQLDQLNDLFGELTIERNRLALEVKRLRTMISNLIQRSQVLDDANSILRTTYDKIAVQTRGNGPLSSLNGSFNLNDTNRETNKFNNSSEVEKTTLDQGASSSDLSKFDALEMDRYGDLHSVFQEVMETVVQVQELTGDIVLGLEDTEQTTRDLNKTSRHMQTSLTQLRMRPLADVTDRFPRALREMALQYNKPVKLKVYGGSTLVDRNILETLNDPLMHILRNAFDHGIEMPEVRQRRGKPEEGVIEIRAFHRSNKTVITISDDGGGIPLEKIRARALQMGLDQTLLATANEDELLSLIFEPGFSTADRVTQLSGRGIGMDVVRNNLKQIQGEIKVSTQAGVGTTFTISVPFTLSVTRVLLAESYGLLLAFPTDVIEEMTMFDPGQIMTTLGGEAFNWDGSMVQLIRLSQWLKFNSPRSLEGLETPPNIDSPTILMLKHNGQLVGVQIDRSWSEQEVAVRRVEGGPSMPPGFTNCTILGDGRVVPLVNVPELLHWINSCDRSNSSNTTTSNISLHSSSTVTTSLTLSHLSSASTIPALPGNVSSLANHHKSFEQNFADQKSTILIVDDSINVRRLLALSLEKAGYRVAQAKDGQDALDKLRSGLQVEAVICDIEMPRLDGYGFLAKIKSSPNLEYLPIFMLTSRSGNKHRQLAMSLGASAYFSKPYDERTLFQALREAIQDTRDNKVSMLRR
jgi:two-component system, chemotaxis family, sensor histidine kinase and response regulator PixL